MIAPPPNRDASFLRMAAIAGAGGIAAIVCAIAFPIWAWLHGRPYTPAFSLFAAWGIAALGGAYACIRTYLVSGVDPPPRPRGGVVPFPQHRIAAAAAPPESQSPGEQRAA